MLPSTSNRWMLLLAYAFVPSDFRKEWNTDSSVFPVSQLLSYMGCLPIFHYFHSYFRLTDSSSQLTDTPLAFCVVFEGRTLKMGKHQENVSHEQFKKREITLLVKWQIGGDMAKEQKIMDATEKVDWIPLCFYLWPQEKGIFCFTVMRLV